MRLSLFPSVCLRPAPPHLEPAPPPLPQTASANLGGSGDFVSLLATLKQTHAILERGEALATPEGQQLGK